MHAKGRFWESAVTGAIFFFANGSEAGHRILAAVSNRWGHWPGLEREIEPLGSWTPEGGYPLSPPLRRRFLGGLFWVSRDSLPPLPPLPGSRRVDPLSFQQLWGSGMIGGGRTLNLRLHRKPMGFRYVFFPPPPRKTVDGQHSRPAPVGIGGLVTNLIQVRESLFNMTKPSQGWESHFAFAVG